MSIKIQQQHLILLAITGIGIWLRFSTLTAREFWYDEAYTGLLMQQPWGEMWNLILADVHPPLYYLLLKIWTLPLGVTDWSLRSFSALWGVILIPVTYVFAKNFFTKSNWQPLLVAGVIAINPFFIAYSQEARTYALVAVLFLLTVHFLYCGLHTNHWLWFSIFATASFFSHYTTSFGLIVCLIIMLGHKKFPWKNLIIPIVAVGAWLPIVIHQMQTNRGVNSWIPAVTWFSVPRSLYAFLYGVDHTTLGLPPVNELLSGTITWWIIWLNAVAFVAITILAFRSKVIPRALLTIVLPIGLGSIGLMIIASWLGYNMYVERYMIGYGLVLVLYGVMVMASYAKWLVSIGAVAYLILLCFLPATSTYSDNRDQTFTKEIVTEDALHFLVLKYYASFHPNASVKLYDQNNQHGYSSWRFIDESDVLTESPVSD